MPNTRELFFELDHIDRDTLEIKKDYQYFGCPFCNQKEGTIVDTVQTRKSLFFKFRKCANCSLIYAYPRPNQQLIEEYFSSSQLAFKVDTKKTVSWLRRLIRRLPLFYSYQEFTGNLHKGQKVLEIGAGAGELTKMLINKGCQMDIVELNPERAEHIKRNLKANVFQTRLEDFQAHELYDAVILSQVLMHLFSVGSALKKVHSLLKPNGIIICSMMNFDSVVQTSIRTPYPGCGLTPYTITSWFTEESAQKIFPQAGFSVKKIIHRPEGLLSHLFREGFPKGLRGFLLRIIDQIINIILVSLGKTSYFSVVAQKN